MSPRGRLASPLLVALLLAPAAARAADPAAAQALFDEGKQLMADGRYAEACPKLEESLRLDQGLGTEFRLADCWQRVGRTASAWAMFRQVESEAHTLGQTGRERVAHDRAEAIGAFLSRLIIDVPPDAATPGLMIARDGEDVSHAMWGVPVPVDPGPHVVRAKAPDKQPWETTVQVMPDGKNVRVDVPNLTAAPAPPAVAPPALAVAPAPVPPPPPSRPPRPGVTSAMPADEDATVVENRGGFQRAVGWFFIGAGVVGLGASAYFGTRWLQEQNAPEKTTQNDALAQRDSAEAALGVGAAALFVGTILVASAPGPRLVLRHDARLGVAPVVSPREGGLVLRGMW
jgi:serine/threonine-protein kinase